MFRAPTDTRRLSEKVWPTLSSATLDCHRQSFFGLDLELLTVGEFKLGEAVAADLLTSSDFADSLLDSVSLSTQVKFTLGRGAFSCTFNYFVFLVDALSVCAFVGRDRGRVRS